MHLDKKEIILIEYIKSIGFIKIGYEYEYKEYKILVNKVTFFLRINNVVNIYYMDDLTPLEKEFKKELRSIKLKKILG